MQSNKNLKILIVEDDFAQITMYKHLLKELNFHNVESASNYQSSIDSFKSFNPDIALVDFNLNDTKDGVDVAKAFNEVKKIPLIFITSCYFDEYYERAKTVEPVAFLDKDISKLKIQQAIELGLNAHNEDRPNQQSDKLPDYFFVRANSGLKKIVTKEIDWIEVEGKYCCLQSNGKKYPIRISLKELQEKLPENLFKRVHQSYSVNIEKVTSFNSNDNLIFIDDKQIPIGRFYKKDLTDFLYLI